MSGPIVRKYGFPNFDKIFGERPLEHGADEAEGAESSTMQPAAKKDQTESSSQGTGPAPERKPQ
jgi:hypothetical protein